MEQINVSLTEEQKDFIRAEVVEGGYVSSSEFIRDLIRQRRRSKAELAWRSSVQNSTKSLQPHSSEQAITEAK